MKSFVIAFQTLQSYARDRLFHAVSVFALLLIVFASLLSSLTIVEHQKILLDFGLAAVSLVGIAFAVLLGSMVIRREIDNHTIYTILAKPVRRSEYVVGKFLGAATALALIHTVSAVVLGGLVMMESGGWPSGLWPATLLMALESILVLGAAICFSLFFSSVFVAVAITVATFLVGRSSYFFASMAERAEGALQRFLFRLAHDVFPALQRFDIRDLVAYAKPYPAGMVGEGLLYFAAYLIFLLSVAVLLMSRKDLK